MGASGDAVDDSGFDKDRPQPEQVHISFRTVAGVRDFASYKFHSFKKGAQFVTRAQKDIVKERKLLDAAGSLGERELRGRCHGSTAGEPPYDLKITFENSAGGPDLDWAYCSCSCPYAKDHEVCKHSLALLLARLSPADWVAAGGDPAAAEAAPAPAPAPAPAAAAGAAAAARAAAAAGAGGSAPAAAARPAASQGSSQQGAAPRKRVLPASLLAPKPEPAPAKRPKTAAPPKPKPPHKPKPPPKPRQPAKRAPGKKAVAAAAAAEPEPEQYVVYTRMFGARLLDDPDEELVRQCHAELAKPAAEAAVAAPPRRAIKREPSDKEQRQQQQQQQAAVEVKREPLGAGPAQQQQQQPAAAVAVKHEPLAAGSAQQQPPPPPPQQSVAVKHEPSWPAAAPPAAPAAAPAVAAAPPAAGPPKSLFAALFGFELSSVAPAPQVTAAPPPAPAAGPPAGISEQQQQQQQQQQPQQQQQQQQALAHVHGLSALPPGAQREVEAALQDAAFHSESGASSAYEEDSL